MGTRAFVGQLARRTGLNRRTIKNLMINGWTYHEEHENVPYFQHPLSTTIFPEIEEAKNGQG